MPSKTTLVQLDSLLVNVLVDNQTDSYSSKPSSVVSEFANVITAGAKELSGTTLCCAQLGFSVMLTATSGGKQHKMLFDAGPEGALFVRNAKNLGVKLNDAEAVAVSHGHWDHMGALLDALDEITERGKRKVDCHVNPDMFNERAVRIADGRVIPFEKVPSVETLTAHGANVVNDGNERYLLDDFFYLSGEIPRVTDFEKGRVDHLCRDNENAPWRPDPLLVDERYLAAHIKNKGLVVFSSCSHAGIVNVLHSVRSTFPDIPIFAAFGGLHLVAALEKIIPDTIEDLKQFDLKQIVPAHCTGWRAQNALLNTFGHDVVVPCAVGSAYSY